MKRKDVIYLLNQMIENVKLASRLEEIRNTFSKD